MRHIRGLSITAMFLAAFWIWACGRQAPKPSGPTVVVSIEPQAYLAEQIGGNRVKVITLLRPGESPATYQPTDAQVSQVMQAGVYFRIGVPFEHGQWRQSLDQTPAVRVVDVSQGIPRRSMEADHHPESPASAPPHPQAAPTADPHIWLTPRLLKIQARTMAAALMELDPDYQDTYRRNLADLETRLDAVDLQIRRSLDALEHRVFFVFHPCWGYFADEYRLQQVAVELEGKEPSDQELTALQRQARELHVTTIFVQPQIAGRTAQALATALGGRAVPLDPLAHDVPRNLLAVATALAEAQATSRSRP